MRPMLVCTATLKWVYFCALPTCGILLDAILVWVMFQCA